MFNVSINSGKSSVIVQPQGRLDTVNSTLFMENIRDLLEREEYLIVDFAGCSYLSSSGIRSLMMAVKGLKAKGGALLLTGLVPELHQVLEMTGLLPVFPVYATNEEAEEEVVRLIRGKSVSIGFQVGQHQFSMDLSPGKEKFTTIWHESEIAGYDELSISAGYGSPAETVAEEPNSRGLFVTVGNCSGIIPSGQKMPPDFRVVHDASGGGIFVHWAMSFRDQPGGMIRLVSPGNISPVQLIPQVIREVENQGFGKVGGMVIAGMNLQTPSLAVVFLVPGKNPDGKKIRIPEALMEFFVTPAEGIFLFGARFLLNGLNPFHSGSSFSDFVNHSLTIDNIEGITSFDLSTEWASPVVWLFTSGGWKDAAPGRIRVEPADGFAFEPYQAFLARRLYRDSARIVIHPLHGGYSAQTFQVDSYDREGRKLRPTVLKISSRALINREADRCKRYALPYIMNNSAIVLGTVFYGDMGALRYNFVGIGGEQTRLKWLTHYYNIWPAGKLEPLFDKIFMQILKPWYGQPVRETIYPFRDHNPTKTFFPRLCEVAEEVLGINTSEPYFTVQETGRKLVNPYWFLKFEYERRKDEGIDYHTAICHGDLNMQNILLDDDLNIYLIDFSETRPRAVVSDFARLEAIFMVERAPLEDEEDLKEITRFVAKIYDTNRLDLLPEDEWTGKSREIMDRNLSMTKKMRQYGFSCSGGEPSVIPYYIAMLEWVLPVVCYTGVPLLHKKLSATVAGLLCGKLMEKGTE